ncbi:hypothetical protein ABTF05_22235, partial [Acinetobacter baumannii]
MVPTETMRGELSRWGFANLALWARGVDTQQFRPRPAVKLGYPGPVMLSVGRLAVEKNLEAFLALDLP